MLTEEEKLLVLKYQDQLSRKKIIAALNEGRKAKDIPLLPKDYRYRLQILPPGGSYKGHPIEYFLERHWRPSKEFPISTMYLSLYGEDYLLGYLDGYEGKSYGESVGTRSESYARSFVDGLIARHRSKS